VPSDDDPRSDAQLVAAINAGDEAAFAALYYRYRDWSAALAMRFTANHADALDAVQDAFIYLAGKFPGFVLTSKFTTFFYVVIKSTALAIVRKRRRVINDDMVLSQAAGEAGAAFAGSPRAELAAVMAALPEMQREVVLMRFVDGFTLEDIGQALDIPLGTVKSRLHNALAALRANPAVRRYFQQPVDSS